MLWATNVCSRATFARPGPVSSISLGWFSQGFASLGPLYGRHHAPAVTAAITTAVIEPASFSGDTSG